MTAQPHRLLMHQRPDGVEEVRARAEALGWRLIAEYPVRDGGQPLELVWTIPGVDGELHFTHDTIAEYDYFFRGTGDTEGLLVEVEQSFDILPDGSVIDGLESPDPVDRARAVMAVSLMSQRVQPDALDEIMLDAATDPNALVRRRTVLAVGYLDDRRWIGFLEDLAAADDDPAVIDEALRIAEGLARHAPEE